MRITKVIFFSFLFYCLYITNIAQFLRGDNFYSSLSNIFIVFTLFFLPGILIFLLLKIEKTSFWLNSILSVGFSISFLEFGGLLLNSLLPRFGIFNPLSRYPLLFGLDSLFFILFICAWFRTRRDFKIILRKPEISLRLYFSVVPTLFPLLALSGAIILNNNGTGRVTLFLLGAIGVYIFFLLFKKDVLPRWLFPYSIYMISLALLFTTSLRSWYITGHDIQQEYYVFQLAKKSNLWNINVYKDAYNACLSITILPTIIARLMFINEVYIYKVIFQFLFATVPVLAYLFFKRFTSPFFAFLSSIYIVSFPTFYNDMPMLNRQEIGFLFFGLVFAIFFNKQFTARIKNVLFLFFGISLTVSHYSTNYIFLALLLMTYIFSKLLIVFEKRKIHKVQDIYPSKVNFSGITIIVLFLFTFFWNVQVTKTADNIAQTFIKTIQEIAKQTHEDFRSADIAYSLFLPHKTDFNTLVTRYISRFKQGVKNKNAFYDPSSYSPFPVEEVFPATLPITVIGRILTGLHIPVFAGNSLLRKLAAIGIQIFVFLGIGTFFLYKGEKRFDRVYVLLCISGGVLLCLMVVLPQLSVSYGLLRLFEQLLFFLALPIVLATEMLATLLKQSAKAQFLSTCIVVFFFLNLTGFISHITGGYYPQMTLDNAGLYYDAYYTHTSDIVAVEWFSKNRVQEIPVQSDLPGSMRLQTYGTIFASNQIFPPLILRDAYIYLPEGDMKEYVPITINSDTLLINSPDRFLSENKDVIYNDGSTKIYK